MNTITIDLNSTPELLRTFATFIFSIANKNEQPIPIPIPTPTPEPEIEIYIEDSESDTEDIPVPVKPKIICDCGIPVTNKTIHDKSYRHKEYLKFLNHKLRTDFSNGGYYCELCRKFVSNNRNAINKHNKTQTHIANEKKKNKK